MEYRFRMKLLCHIQPVSTRIRELAGLFVHAPGLPGNVTYAVVFRHTNMVNIFYFLLPMYIIALVGSLEECGP